MFSKLGFLVEEHVLKTEDQIYEPVIEHKRLQEKLSQVQTLVNVYLL
jgi:hypothetical protein